MTVADAIRSLLTGAEGIYTPKAVATHLGLNSNTVRRVMRELAAKGMFRQEKRGEYEYSPTSLFVYKYEGFKDTRWNMTFTADHELSGSEMQKNYIELSDEYGNVELVAEGEAPFEEDRLGWDYEDTEKDS